MDALAKLVEAKKAKNKEFLAGRKFAKRVEREDAELKAANAGPAPKRHAPEPAVASKPAASPADGASTETESSTLPISRSLSNKARAVDLPAVEVVRRLRTLGQPKTLFAEDDHARRKRLLQAESEIAIEDEGAGGAAQGNILHEARKLERREDAAAAAAAASWPGGSSSATEARRADDGTTAPADGDASAGPRLNERGKDGDADAEEEPVDPVRRDFEAAAKRLAEKRKVEAMCLEDRILYYVQLHMAEWKTDLDNRSQEARLTSKAKEASDAFALTNSAFQAVYPRLHAREGIHQEVLLGIGMMITAMHERNYSSAIETYLRLSIGNATWPIGVTSVGIHARSARERISHYANAPSQAHIMNDEATRKFLQGMKRLVSAYQRLHPTDPSRSVNFNAVSHEGLGAIGGSEKTLFLKNEADGLSRHNDKYVPAPHFMDKHGGVRIPQKWGNQLRAEEARMEKKQ